MKYAFIERAAQCSHAVRKLCRALAACQPSGYYAARSRPPSARDGSAIVLWPPRSGKCTRTSRQTYGAPRVHAELSVLGVACCRNTVAKLMRREQIVPRAIQALPIDDRFAQYQGRLAELG